MADLTYPSLFRNRIVTIAASPPKDMVTTICDNVFSLKAIQRDAIVKKWWARLADFQDFKYDRIQTWARESNHLPASRGGCYFGSIAMAKLQGLAYWADRMLLCGHTLVCDGFDAAMMRKLMDDAKIHYAESKQDSDAQTLSKLDPKDRISSMIFPKVSLKRKLWWTKKSKVSSQSSKWKIAYVPLNPVADYINMLN